MQVDKVWFFTVADERFNGLWSLEDSWARLLQLGTTGDAIEAATRPAR